MGDYFKTTACPGCGRIKLNSTGEYEYKNFFQILKTLIKAGEKEVLIKVQYEKCKNCQ